MYPTYLVGADAWHYLAVSDELCNGVIPNRFLDQPFWQNEFGYSGNVLVSGKFGPVPRNKYLDTKSKSKVLAGVVDPII